jgi:hypothetical protein
VNVGDLVEFRCIGAGKTDNPPYSQDGEWRTGVVLSKKKITFEVLNILYRGQIFVALTDNCRLIGDV